MYIVCSDLEGVFVPEIWIHFAEKTGIDELRLTTRDIADYDTLMQHRLKIMRNNNLKLKDIQDTAAAMEPLEGALPFLDWLRSELQLIIISDTYIEFTKPLMQKMGWPTLFCHSLSINAKGTIENYHLRQKESKRKTVLALQKLNYRIISIGDSYNDISMLQTAEAGILFRPPVNVKNEYAHLPVATDYNQLKQHIQGILKSK